MSLMEMFSNPETIDQLSVGDKLGGASITTLMGMGITFVVLILLWGIIAVMARVLRDKDTPAAPAPKATPAPAAVPVAAAEVMGESDSLDEALVAVITAAIAAYEANTVTSNLIVRKISRISGQSTAWSSAGNIECIESRKM